MWVVEHVAIGYLVWSGWSRYREGRPPTGAEFWLVLLGALLPDLVDKPLAWTFGVLPAGRSLAHSLLTASVLVVAARRVARRRGDVTLGTAFGVAYLSHLAADVVFPIISGRYAYTYFLLWPLLPLPYYDTSRSLVGEVLLRIPGGFSGPHLVVALLVLLVWVRDKMPGVPWAWFTWRAAGDGG